MQSSSEPPGTHNVINLLRWIAMPVAAVGGVLVLMLIMRTVVPVPRAQPLGTPPRPPSEFRRLVLPPVSRILMAATFVAGGAVLAPRRRFATALTLALLWCLYALATDLLVHRSWELRYLLNFAVSVAAALGTACLFCRSAPRSAE